MKYTYLENEQTGELRIMIDGEPLQLSRCARIILDVTQGVEHYNALRAKVDGERLSGIEIPETIYLGSHEKEIFKFSRARLEYNFSPDGHPKEMVAAAKNHYNVILSQLSALMAYYDSPTDLLRNNSGNNGKK